LIATMIVRASGYRVVGRIGHHFYTFQALRASDARFEKVALFFDDARDKRNDFSYDCRSAVSETDAEDLIDTTTKFRAELWIAANYPSLV
jgi:hypothetical protein